MTHFHSQLHDPSPNPGARIDNDRNQKLHIFDRRGIFRIKSQKRVLNVGNFQVSYFVK